VLPSRLNTTGLTGLGVTVVVSGYDTLELTAPSSGSTAGLPVIGAAAFATVASNTQVSGAFHSPNGQIYI
jgi:hypothetical protein